MGLGVALTPMPRELKKWLRRVGGGRLHQRLCSWRRAREVQPHWREVLGVAQIHRQGGGWAMRAGRCAGRCDPSGGDCGRGQRWVAWVHGWLLAARHDVGARAQRGGGRRGARLGAAGGPLDELPHGEGLAQLPDREARRLDLLRSQVRVQIRMKVGVGGRLAQLADREARRLDLLPRAGGSWWSVRGEGERGGA